MNGVIAGRDDSAVENNRPNLMVEIAADAPDVCELRRQSACGLSPKLGLAGGSRYFGSCVH
jgi:hypothetical protein